MRHKKIFRQDLANAVSMAGRLHSMNLVITSIVESPDEKTIEVTLRGVSVMSDEEQKFITLCARYGMSPEHYGEVFHWGNKIYKLVGFKQNAPKRPVEVVDLDTNKRTRLTLAAIHKIKFK